MYINKQTSPIFNCVTPESVSLANYIDFRHRVCEASTIVTTAQSMKILIIKRKNSVRQYQLESQSSVVM